MLKKFFLIILINKIFVEAISNKSSNLSNDLTLPWRLPHTVIPHFYNLQLIPILDQGFEQVPELGEQWSVRGYVEIKVEALENVTNIKLHAKNLYIEDIEVYNIIFLLFNSKYNNN